MARASVHVQRDQVHFGWSRDHEPIMAVASGTEITVQTQDASGGQLRPGSTSASVADLEQEQ